MCVCVSVGWFDKKDRFVRTSSSTHKLSVAFRRRSMPFSVDEVEQFKVETIQMLFIRYESKTQQWTMLKHEPKCVCVQKQQREKMLKVNTRTIEQSA